MQNVIVVTACGKTKRNTAFPAWKLYKSPRIRFLKKKADILGVDLYILSAKYGLVHSEEIIEPYEAVMTKETCTELILSILNKLENIKPSKVIYYKGGARKEYFECIYRACTMLNIKLLCFGYANMGDIKRIDEFINVG